LKRFLERKDISYLSVIVAIGIKTALYLHFFQLEGDKLFQALGAKSLIEGRGITFQHVSAHDLSTQITETVNRWPIGYSLVLAPLYRLTGSIEAACVILDVLSICFFFIILYKLLNHLQLQRHIIASVILFTGATFGPCISKPTDLLACGALLYACLLFLTFTKHKSKAPAYGLAIGAAVMMPAVFRYMYVPAVLAIPLLLIWIGNKKKDTRIKTGGVCALLVTIALLAGFLVLQKVVVGNATYMTAAEKGFFPRNLLMMYPFIPDAFFDVNFITQQVVSFTGLSLLFLFECLQYANLILLAILLYKWIVFLFKRKSWGQFDYFIMLIGVTSVSVLILLIYLSLTNSSAAIPLHIPLPWTFIGDGRYFLFPVTVLPVIAAYWLFTAEWRGFRKYQRPLQYLFLIIIIFQLTHTLYFISRRFYPLGLKGGNVMITHQIETYLHERIKQIKQKGYDVALTGTNETVSNWAALNDEKGVLHVTEFFAADIRPKQPTVVVVLIEAKMLPYIQDKLAEKNFRIEKQINGLSVFSKIYGTLE
jgi:hypothetical protein